MRVAAVGQAEAGSGLKQMVGVCGEGGAGCEGDESGPVGVESWGAAVAAAAGDVVKDGACEMGWISQYQAQRGRSEVQRLSVAVSGGGMGAASAVAPAVCGAHCYLHSFLRCQLHLACPLQQLLLCWRSEKESAPACPRKTPQSFV